MRCGLLQNELQMSDSGPANPIHNQSPGSQGHEEHRLNPASVTSYGGRQCPFEAIMLLLLPHAFSLLFIPSG